MEIRIGHKVISPQGKPYFIADIAANHDGDLARAYKLIELAKEAGADAAKFQNFKAAKIVSKQGFNSLGTQLGHQAAWQKSVFEIYQEASIADEWSAKLKEKCDTIGIEYMTSPYDFSSVDLADNFVNAYKIGSGDITWPEILEHIAKKKKPVLLASGASSLEDVDRALGILARHTSQIVLMQCNTNYTGAADNFKYINLNVLKTYAQKYPNYILGLSDHTPGHSTVLGALALGARVFEKHFTDDTLRQGPDHKFSMTPAAWSAMVAAANELYLALGDGLKRIEDNEQDTVFVQRRAIYLNKSLKKGDIISRACLEPLRPVKPGAVLPYQIEQVMGKALNKDKAEDSVLNWEDIDK